MNKAVRPPATVRLPGAENRKAEQSDPIKGPPRQNAVSGSTPDNRKLNADTPRKLDGEFVYDGKEGVTTVIRTTPSPLDAEQRAERDSLEKTIESGLKQFVEVGTALARIKDAKLWRLEYTSFEQYLEIRWKMGKAHGYRLISAAQIVTKTLREGGVDIEPSNETQVRPLLRLDTESQRLEAWRDAVKLAGSSPVTEKIVTTVVDKIKKPSKGKTTQPTPAKTGAASKAVESVDTVIAWIDAQLAKLGKSSKNKTAVEMLAQVREKLKKV